MDDLLLSLQNVSAQLLPILGAVALIFLCISLKKLANFLEELTELIKNLDPTVKLLDESMAKVQAPLDTVVKLSHSVEKVHDKTSETLHKASVYAAENIGQVKEYIQNKINVADLEETKEN